MDATEDTDNDDPSDLDPLIPRKGTLILHSKLLGLNGSPRERFSIIGLTTVLSLVFLADIAYRKSGQATPGHHGEVQIEHSSLNFLRELHYVLAGPEAVPGRV